MRHRTPTRVAAIAGMLLLLQSAVSRACNTPVFRYAFENWAAETWTVFVLCVDELDEHDRDRVRKLEAYRNLSGPEEEWFEVVVVDVPEEVTPACKTLYEANRDGPFPLMAVCYPSREGTPDRPGPAVWTGSVAQGASLVLDSPKGREIARWLTRGDCVVWVFLDGGDNEADEEAFERLKSALLRDGESLTLPQAYLETLESDARGTRRAGKPPIRFEAVRMSSGNAAEQLLIQTLLRSEPDLTSERYGRQPKAFAVYGRGRALPALVGRGISEKMVRRRNTFLVGACSCAAKAANPGFQLPIFLPWNAAAAGPGGERPSSDRIALPSIHVVSSDRMKPAGAAPAMEQRAEAEATTECRPTVSPPAESGSLLTGVAVAFAAILLAVLAGTAIAVRRRRRKSR